jgi:putative DNA primase/helicase
VTYLTPGGRRADDLRLSRKTVGLAPGGCAVRLDPAATAMLVAEGVFTTLSATERFGLPGWALLSTRNLRAWRAPPGVRSVLIAGDRGKDGEVSAARLRARLEADGVAAFIELPPEPFGDWNEWAQR